LTWQEAKERCPSGVVPACHNAEDTVTISGPAEAVRTFVAQLKEEGYFAKEVASNGVAFHSYYMSAIAPKLQECLSKVQYVQQTLHSNSIYLYVVTFLSSTYSFAFKYMTLILTGDHSQKEILKVDKHINTSRTLGF